MSSGFLSNLNTASHYAFRSSIGAQAAGRRNSIELLLKKGKPGLHSFVQPISNSSRFEDKRSHPFVAGALSQSNCAPFMRGLVSQQTYMATSGSKATTGDIVVDSLISSSGNVSSFLKPAGVYFNDQSVQFCKKSRVGLRNQERICSSSDGFHVLHATRRSGNSEMLNGPWRSIHTTFSPCYSDGIVPYASLDGSVREEEIAVSPASINQKSLRLQTGVCYLPHPEKEKTGGEDAHFICGEEQAIGVADGVGGWAEVGVNAGNYARELMSNSVAAIKDEPNGSIDPARVLERAYSLTKSRGSSTACIVTLTNEGLHAINLGDSGFIVVREGCIIFESPVQQHDFNFTYQLENGENSDLPSSGQVFTIPVVAGDVIVLGTDGLFDNLFNNEITSLVVSGLEEELAPHELAQNIAALARKRALDRKRQSPFSKAAQEAGYRFFGGKLDDTTVVVSYVAN